MASLSHCCLCTPLRWLVAATILANASAGADENACGRAPEILGNSGPNATIVCEEGCYDTEDEACHEGLSKNQCAEIYGHVTWGAFCKCKHRSGNVLSTNVAGGKAEKVNLYFSIPAFVVLFRESLEVVIILAIIIQFLTKAKQKGDISEELFKRLRREVYLGAGIGFLCCLILGAGLLALASLARGLFKCDGLLIFDGVIMMITAVILTFLALNFYKMIHTKEAHELKMKQQVDDAIANAKEAGKENTFGKKYAFFIFAFSTGLREGLESIIFLIGVISDFKDPSYMSSLPIPLISALILSRIVGCIFFQGTKRMNVEYFMRFCSVLLLFIAAGFFTSSMHKWQELELFGTWSPLSERPWQNQKVWDASDCCNDKTNRFFVLMRALLGWQDQPTPMEFLAYVFYWIIAITAGVVLVRHAKRTIKSRLEMLRKQASDASTEEELKTERVPPNEEEEGRLPTTGVNASDADL